MNMRVFSPYPISKSTIVYFSEEAEQDQVSMFNVIKLFSETKEKYRKLYFKYDPNSIN